MKPKQTEMWVTQNDPTKENGSTTDGENKEYSEQRENGNKLWTYCQIKLLCTLIN